MSSGDILSRAQISSSGTPYFHNAQHCLALAEIFQGISGRLFGEVFGVTGCGTRTTGIGLTGSGGGVGVGGEATVSGTIDGGFSESFFADELADEAVESGEGFFDARGGFSEDGEGFEELLDGDGNFLAMNADDQPFHSGNGRVDISLE